MIPVYFPNLQAERRWECPAIPSIRLTDSAATRAEKGKQFISDVVKSLGIAYPAPSAAELGTGLYARADVSESRRGELHEWYLERVSMEHLGAKVPRMDIDRAAFDRLLAEARRIFWPEGEDPHLLRKEWQSLKQAKDASLRLFSARWLEKLQKVRNNPAHGAVPVSDIDVASVLVQALNDTSMSRCGGKKRLEEMMSNEHGFSAEDFMAKGIKTEQFNMELKSHMAHITPMAQSTPQPATQDKQRGNDKSRFQRRKDERMDRQRQRNKGTVHNLSFDAASGEESEDSRSDRSDRLREALSCWLCGEPEHRWTQCEKRRAAEKEAGKAANKGEIKLPFMPKHFRPMFLRGYSKPARDDKSPQRKPENRPSKRASPGGPSTSSTPKRKAGILKQGSISFAQPPPATPAKEAPADSRDRKPKPVASSDEIESSSEDDSPRRSQRSGRRRS